jgi:hypothetical protein
MLKRFINLKLILYNIYNLLYVIIYNNCLWLVLYPKVLICFEFMECKQIQLKIKITNFNNIIFIEPINGSHGNTSEILIIYQFM